MKKIVVSLTVLVALATIAGAITAWWVWQQWTEPSTTAETRVVLVPRGTGLRGTTDILSEAGVLDEPTDRLVFPLMVKLDRAAAGLRAGEYQIPAGASMAEVVAQLSSGAGLVQHSVTVPEGLTTPEILALVRGADVLTGEITQAPAEGDLLPETYHVLRGDARDAVVGRMREAMEKTLAELWPGRDEDLPITTPEQAVILASIVEKETAVAAERPRVAAVFVNRLRRGMPLQSDPTVIYGMAPETGQLDRPLLRKDLEVDTPWNTYTRPGLPQTPIANPGRESLAAVLHPAQTKDLYFVADGSGGHAFAETLTEHNRNVAKWRRVQREQGE